LLLFFGWFGVMGGGLCFGVGVVGVCVFAVFFFFFGFFCWFLGVVLWVFGGVFFFFGFFFLWGFGFLLRLGFLVEGFFFFGYDFFPFMFHRSRSTSSLKPSINDSICPVLLGRTTHCLPMSRDHRGEIFNPLPFASLYGLSPSIPPPAFRSSYSPKGDRTLLPP